MEMEKPQIVIEWLPNPHPFFNGVANRKVRKITVTGGKIVIDPEDGNGLFAALSINTGNADIGKVKIEGETVIIGGALWIPGASVEISARHLQFLNKPGLTGSLITMPIGGYPEPAAQFESGHEGQAGGDILLTVATITPRDKELRLNTTGGQGQAAGRGAPGAAGPSRALDLNDLNGTYGADPGAMGRELEHHDPGGCIIRYEKYDAITGHVYAWCPAESWAATAQARTPGDARPGGQAGKGGQGGSLTVCGKSDLLPENCKLDGGPHGAPCKPEPGGAAPPTGFLMRDNSCGGYEITNSDAKAKGKDADPPAAPPASESEKYEYKPA